MVMEEKITPFTLNLKPYSIVSVTQAFHEHALFAFEGRINFYNS